MTIDLELYRRGARVSIHPPVRLSVIDILPDQPRHILVFLHGYGGYALQWRYQLEKLSFSNRTIAVDLRGHGHSDKPQGAYSMDVIIDDLETVLYTLGINTPIYLLGHSFGGAVAAEFAAAHPDRIEGLVLVATANHYKLNPFYRLLLKLPDWILQSFAPLVRNWLNAPPFVMKSWYEDNLAHWDGSSLYPRLVLPTMVIRGHLDSVFEKPAYEEVPRAIPNVEEVDVGASGHMVMLERREAVNRAITRFIDRASGASAEAETYQEDPQRASLLKFRPWLPQYDRDIPYTIAIPRVPLQSLLDSAARRFPNRPALIYESRKLSYRRLLQEANRFANALRSLDVEKGERVLLLMPNLPQLVIAFYGTLKSGAVVVFAPPDTQPADLLRLLHESAASVLVTSDQHKELIHQANSALEGSGIAALRHILVIRSANHPPNHSGLEGSGAVPQANISSSSAIHDFHRLLKAQTTEAPEVEQSVRDIAVIQYSSGAGTSYKGVMLSHRNLLANTLQIRHWMSDAREGQERFLSAVPLSHSYGLTAALNVPVALGATILLQRQFEVQNVLNAIQQYRPTVFPGVPQMFIAIKDFAGVRKFGVESIRICISSSEPLAIEVLEAFEKLTRGRLIEGYGLTEASPITHITPINGIRKAGSIGIPLPSTEAKLVDLRKGVREVPPGQIGELAVRGPQIMIGYWQNQKETQHVLSSQGWLLTGDIAQMDSEGYFRIISSKEDAWYPTRPDRPASLRAVEEVLHEVPQVKEAVIAVVAGQPVAFVIADKDRLKAETLIAYCKRRLPRELVPRMVIFVEEFPRSYIGKVLRNELTRRLEQQTRPEPDRVTDAQTPP